LRIHLRAACQTKLRATFGVLVLPTQPVST
jgi:hypothetical protein